MKVLEGIKVHTKYLKEGISIGPFDLDHSYDLRRVIRYRSLSEEKYIVGLDIESYDILKRELVNNGAEVEESSAFADVVKKALAIPPWFADIKEKRVVVYARKKNTRHRLQLYDIPSCEWNYNKSRFEIPLADAWRLDDVAIEFADILELSVDLRAYMLTQGERRAKLDIIAQQDDSDIELPKMGGVDFKPFQKVAVDFLVTNGYKGLMAYDMGLGKTLIALTAAEKLRETKKDKKLKVLCTVPTAVIPNWSREIKKYCGENTPVYIIEGGSPKSVDTLTKVLSHDDGYFLIGYPSMGSYVKAKARRDIKDDGTVVQHDEEITYMWSSLLNKADFDLQLSDESHFIKNRGSHRSKGIRKLNIPRVIQLSGTPLLNRPGELWPLVAIHDKVLAGPAETFERHFTSQNGRNARNLDELKDTLKTFMLRRTKKDVMKDLPPLNRIEQEHNLSDGAWDRYQQVLLGIYTELDGMGNIVREKDVPNILARIMRLKQVCAQDKVEYVADLATEIYDQTEAEHKKVLIFSQFVNNPAIVPDVAKRLGGEALWFSGKDKPEKRQELVDRFNEEDDIHFLVAGIQAGGTGLNITAAGSVIFVDLMWRPADHLQAEGRAYGRLIDPHSIDSYYINAVKIFGDEIVPTIEMYIQKLIAAKLQVIESVIDGTEASRMDISIAKEIIQTIIRNRKVLLRKRK